MFKRISLYPPLAFARVGSSPTPCDNFYWGPDDLTPEGTARTKIVPWETLLVTDDGVVTLQPPSNSIVFKDDHGLRPVCPFFEVHVVCEESGKEVERPLTEELLREAKMDARALTWQIDVANLKAFHLTGAVGDRISASLAIPGGDFRRQQLKGR